MSTFKPHKPEKHVVVQLTRREAQVIDELRRTPHGQTIVYKADGKLIRVETSESVLIKEDTKLNLPIIAEDT